MARSHPAKNYRLLFLGSSKVGKTSTIRRFIDDEFNEKYSETSEDIFIRQYLVSQTLVRLELFDTSGNNEFPAMQRLAISSADGAIIVFSLDDPDTFRAAAQLIQTVREIRNDFDQLPIILVGNKCDKPKLVPRLTIQRVLDEFKLLDNPRFRYVEASAKLGENVCEIFGWLAKISGIVENVEAKPKKITKPPPLHRRLSLQIESTLSLVNLKLSTPSSSGPSPVSPTAHSAVMSTIRSRNCSDTEATADKRIRVDTMDKGQLVYRSHNSLPKSPKRFQRFRKESSSRAEVNEVQDCYIM